MELFSERVDDDEFLMNVFSKQVILHSCEWTESEKNNLQPPMNRDGFLVEAEIGIQCR